MALNIINARVVSDGAVRENQTISIDGGTIKNVGERGAISGRTLDAGGLYASAGFIDIHTHGAGGADYMDATEDAFLTAGRASAYNGATTVYPTTMSASNEELFEVFNAFERFRQTKYEGADMPGLHLEGPYFSPRQSGAQDPEYVRAPEPAEYEKILGYGRLIKRWSAAPELQGALEFGKKLSDQGILPAIAHSDASLSELRLALAYGYRLVTHFYCCVSALRYQDGKCRPGIVEGSFLLDDVYIECIGDGIHVVPDLLHMCCKIKGPGRMALCTDSMRAAGTDSVSSILGSLRNGRECYVEGGVARQVGTGIMAASVATAERLLKTAVLSAGIKIADAVAMLSSTPAEIMGQTDRGRIRPGLRADVVLFDESMDLKCVIAGGRVIREEL